MGRLSLDEITFWSVTGQKLATYSVSGDPAVVYGSQPTLTVTIATASYYYGRKLIRNGGWVNGQESGFVGTDRLGSVGSYRFYPWGQEKPSATTNGTEKFTGYFRDQETNNDYAINRYHQPGMGRFLSTDNANPDWKNPGDWNRYAYSGGDPINNVDPDGNYTQAQCQQNPLSCQGPPPGYNCASAGTSEYDYYDSDCQNNCPSIFAEEFFGNYNANWSGCETGAEEPQVQQQPQCSVKLEYRPTPGTENIFNHADIVVTNSSGTQTIQGAPQFSTTWLHISVPFFPVPIPVPCCWGNLTAVKTSGDIGDQQWGNTLTSATDANLCAQIAQMLNSYTQYNNNQVQYSPSGPNSNTFASWLLQQGGIASYFTSPPLSPGWGAPLYGN